MGMPTKKIDYKIESLQRNQNEINNIESSSHIPAPVATKQSHQENFEQRVRMWPE